MTTDILLDPNTFDLLIKDGDFVIGESTTQHQALILATSPGDWKLVPWLGIGIETYINDDANILDLQHEITKQFELDGMTINTLKADDYSDIQIDAHY